MFGPATLERQQRRGAEQHVVEHGGVVLRRASRPCRSPRSPRGPRRPPRARRSTWWPPRRSRGAAGRRRSGGSGCTRSSRTPPGDPPRLPAAGGAARTSDIRFTVARVTPGSCVDVGALVGREPELTHRPCEQRGVHPSGVAPAVLVGLDLHHARPWPGRGAGGSRTCAGRLPSGDRRSGASGTRGTSPRCPLGRGTRRPTGAPSASIRRRSCTSTGCDVGATRATPPRASSKHRSSSALNARTRGSHSARSSTPSSER